EEILKRSADVFGISSICSNFPFAFELADLLRTHHPRARIVLGGAQPSSVPVEAMEFCPAIDAIVIGEGEETFLELLRSRWTEDSLTSIKGLCYRDGEAIRLTAPRPLIEDLDLLPFPDFSLVDIVEYREHSDSLALLEAGRGCPFRCNFCSTAEMWVRKYRIKSPGRIAEEMKVLHAKYSMSYISLTHDNFTTSPKYVRKFCKYFLENGLQGFTWNASARTDTVTVEDLDMMQRAGCRGVFYGVDSGSKRIQDIIDKHLDIEEFKRILDETVNRGISAITSFIVGFPEETVDDLNATVELGLWSKYAGAGEVQFHRLSPLASTKIYSKHFKDFHFSPVVSDISFIIFPEESVLEKIARNPKLFSSYFEVTLPQVPDIDLFCFSNFYGALVNDIGASLHRYLQKTSKTPVGLFKEWFSLNREAGYVDLLRKPYVLDTVSECF
ncbi:MAG: B12-binding domain-containing radical SAM protein, partial [Deltaproteobacteria bacterium]|nr:B12-binding domain-containing radical SAM protein [Deltaproteobacteria bacterium]